MIKKDINRRKGWEKVLCPLDICEEHYVYKNKDYEVCIEKRRKTWWRLSSNRSTYVGYKSCLSAMKAAEKDNG